VIDWLFHPAPIASVPSEALTVIASVAVVIWTGGFIVRGVVLRNNDISWIPDNSRIFVQRSLYTEDTMSTSVRVMRCSRGS
jgi:hypothetical protein